MSNITIHQNNKTISVSFTTFSDGSETCHLVGCTLDTRNTVWVNIDNEDSTRDLIRIGLVKDALSREKYQFVSLNLGYMSQARADRVFGGGMPLPVKVFSDIINSYNFDEVIIRDPHSDVSSALLNNVTVIHQQELLGNHIRQIKQKMPVITLCAPDLGATKKIFDSVQMLGHETYIQAVKIRDVKTGNIIKCEIIDTEAIGGDVLIVDDISDGGASFKFLAQKLKEKGAERVGLFVTHAIFSKGLEILEKDIDFIFCNDIIGTYINREDVRKFNER